MRLKNVWTVAGLAALLWSSAAFAQIREIETVNGHDAAAREVLVKLTVSDAAAIERVARDADAPGARLVGRDRLVLVKSNSNKIATLMQELALNSNVERVEPNYILRAVADTVPNDTYFGLLYAMKNTGQTIGGQTGTPGADIEATYAWNTTTGTRSASVGVVDTGVDYTHSDLSANIWSAPAGGFSFVLNSTTVTCPAGSHGYNFVAHTCDAMDDNGHGTHVSGTIGAVGNNSIGVAGVNWITSIVGLKFLDSKGSGTTADAIDAIDLAVQLKTSGLANIRVLSNS